MSKMEELVTGCPTQVVSDTEVAEGLAEEFAKRYRPAKTDHVALAKLHITDYLSEKLSVCFFRGSFKDSAVIDLVFDAVAKEKGWEKH